MKNIRMLKKIVVGLMIGAILFTLAMIYLYYLYQSVPDSLVYSVFGFLGGEAAISGLIKKAEGVGEIVENVADDIKESSK